MSDDAPERIWLGRDDRYVGEPWLTLVSEFDDEDGAVSQEYVRADIHDAALARVKALEAALARFAKSADARRHSDWRGSVCFMQADLIEARNVLQSAP